MRFTLLIAFVLFAHLLFAQKDLIGLRGGINWSHVKTDTPFEDSDATTGFLGGITYQHQFQSGLYWGVDVLYTERGFEDELIPGTFDPCLGCLRVAAPVDNQFNFDYLSFPVKVGFTFGEQVMFFTDFALVPATLVNGNIETTNSSQEITEADQFDLATQIEIGAAFHLFEGWAAYGSLSYLNSLTSSTNANYFPGDQMLHRNVNLSFGVRYELKRG